MTGLLSSLEVPCFQNSLLPCIQVTPCMCNVTFHSGAKDRRYLQTSILRTISTSRHKQVRPSMRFPCTECFWQGIHVLNALCSLLAVCSQCPVVARLAGPISDAAHVHCSMPVAVFLQLYTPDLCTPVTVSGQGCIGRCPLISASRQSGLRATLMLLTAMSPTSFFRRHITSLSKAWLGAILVVGPKRILLLFCL